VEAVAGLVEADAPGGSPAATEYTTGHCHSGG
jgi:hypothetical protein